MKRRVGIEVVMLCACMLLGASQRCVLRWQGITSYSNGDVHEQLMMFDGASFDEHYNPLFTQAVNSDSVRVYNIEYADCSAEEVQLLQTKSGVAVQEPTWYVQRTIDRGRVQRRLCLSPVVRIGAKYRKMVAFEYEEVQCASKAPKAEVKSSVSSSVLSTGKWFKIKVDASGIYKLTAAQLKTMGCTPDDVRIFGYGGAMLEEQFSLPYQDDLSEVALWRGSDYVLFYAQGPVKWNFDTRIRMMTHVQNPYSDAGYYFVTKDVGLAKSIETGAMEEKPATHDITYFADVVLHEVDEVSLLGSGREFYGEKLTQSSPTLSFTHRFSNPSRYKTSLLRLNVAAVSDVVSSIGVRANDKEIGSVSVSTLLSSQNAAEQGEKVFSIEPPSGNSLQLDIHYQNPLSNSAAYLNYYELNLYRDLVMEGDCMFFRNFDYTNQYYTANCGKYKLASVPAAVEVWNVTDPSNAYRMPTTRNADTLEFVKRLYPLQEFVALNPAATYPSPSIVGEVANQNIHALPMCDMVIIAYEDFVNDARRLAEAHWNASGFVVHVVPVQQVYNEFSSGTPDATAYRRLMKMFYDRLEEPEAHPLYLLLMGDGHFDNRMITDATPETHRLLTYQSVNSIYEMMSYTTDDYFCLMDDAEGKNVLAEAMDISVGRFPVGTKKEAAAMVDKTISYLYNEHKGEWKTKLCFLADDGDGNSHMFEADSVASHLQLYNSDYLVKKIYLDAFKQETSASGESYPMARSVFLNQVKSGALMFNYTGHGGQVNWSNEGLLTMYDIQSMYNKAQGFWVTATCNFGHWDIAKLSGAEALVLQPEGGAIATLSASRTVYSSQNFRLNKNLSEYFFAKDASGNHLRLGDIVRRAKNATDATVNKFTFNLLGDPALVLHYPDQFRVITDSINGHPMLVADTLNALGEVTLSGYVAAADSSVVSDFNGYVHVSVMDKEEMVSTMANDVGSSPFEYRDRPNLIFVGKTAVKDGRFKLVFRLPKDIKYAYGSGRIVYYATDEERGYDANGATTAFCVGGQSDNYVEDNQGPKVQLYLNTPHFVSGDVVNNTPLFVAHIEDESGINVVGSGIGHDIVMRLNNDTHQETVLNDYYEAEFGTYKRGTVRYKMSALDNGIYSLFFRVWDLQNNSTVVNVAFEVNGEQAPHVYTLKCYPNPTTDVLYLVYEHNRPEEILQLTARIFDMQGRLIWTEHKDIGSTSDVSEPIQWDLREGNGQRARQGVYTLNVEIATEGSKLTTNSVKIVVR